MTIDQTTKFGLGNVAVSHNNTYVSHEKHMRLNHACPSSIQNRTVTDKQYTDRELGRVSVSHLITFNTHAQRSGKCHKHFTLGIKCSEFGQQECRTFFAAACMFFQGLVTKLIFEKCATLKRLRLPVDSRHANKY